MVPKETANFRILSTIASGSPSMFFLRRSHNGRRSDLESSRTPWPASYKSIIYSG